MGFICFILVSWIAVTFANGAVIDLDAVASRPWSEWESCSRTCEGGDRWRHRRCSESLNEAICNEGEERQYEACNTQDCTSTPPPTEDNTEPEEEAGSWNTWSPWNTCSASCGGGDQWRYRICTASDGVCNVGSSKEFQQCNRHSCPHPATKINCAEHENGGDCHDKSTLEDTKYCSWKQGATPGTNCIHDCSKFSDEQDCSEVDPCGWIGIECMNVYMMWAAWSECSVTCGVGERRRDRKCIMSEVECTEETMQIDHCDTGVACISERATCEKGKEDKKPNIILILADDLGFSDVAWNNKNIDGNKVHPTLSWLASQGIILNQTYSLSTSSPSRAGLMTGRYPHRFGMQHINLNPNIAYCVPQDTQMLSEALKDLGYVNHYLGKWHLGYCNTACTPTKRGFDSFMGFYNDHTGHMNHKAEGLGSAHAAYYDWQDSQRAYPHARDYEGEYTEDLLRGRALHHIENHPVEDPMFMFYATAIAHAPYEVPPGKVNDPANPRKNYLSILSALDDSVAAIVKALKKKDMYDNSVFIFLSDNGGEVGTGSNRPLRGARGSEYEGGIRIPAMVYSPALTCLSKPDTKSEGLVHVTDWFPSIVGMAGGTLDKGSGLDGKDQQDLLFNNGPSARDGFIVNLDDVIPPRYGYGAIREGNYKLIAGFPGLFDGWEQCRNLGSSFELDLLNKMQDEDLEHSHNGNHKESTLGTYKCVDPCKPWLCHLGAEIESIHHEGLDHGDEHRKKRSASHDESLHHDESHYDINYDQAGIMEMSFYAMHNNETLQLYNIKDDPLEYKNLANNKSYKKLIENLMAKIGSEKDRLSNNAQQHESYNGVFKNTAELLASDTGTWESGWCLLEAPQLTEAEEEEQQHAEGESLTPNGRPMK